MDLFKICMEFFFRVLFSLSGFVAIQRFPLLTVLIRLGHLMWLATAVFLMFYWRMNGGDTSVGGLVGTAAFVFNGSVNILIILESILKYKYYKKIFSLQAEVDELIETQLLVTVKDNQNFQIRIRRTAIILLLQFICDGFKIWINTLPLKVNPIFQYSFPISISLRTRYIQLIVTILSFNKRIEIIKQVLFKMCKKNEPKSKYGSDIWQPYDPKDYEKLNYMRLIYLRMWEIYKTFNHCYSWSLLTLFMTSFFDIVCNFYWTYAAFHTGQKLKYKYIVMNGSTSVSLVSLVAVLFYFTDESENNSRYIGCLTSKLVKPLGNKHYNDLVSEFSVQTLHQRFIVTAKQFFNLNLSLLGSMVAAIATYLIILIQFMFAEEKNNKTKFTNRTSIVTSTMAISTITNIGQGLLGNVTNAGTDTLRTTFLNSTVSTTLKSIIENVTTNMINDMEILASN